MPATDLLSFYQDELRCLRKDARIFSLRHPNLAKHLGLNWGDTPDPMVERLIESMSWFAARIRQDSEARLPLAAQQILANICPNFVSPVPSVAIAHLTPPPGHKGETTVPANSRFISNNPQGPAIRWRTAWDIGLTAARVTSAEFRNISNPCLCLKVRGMADLRALSLFLQGDPYTTHSMHEFVMTNLAGVSFESNGTHLDLGPEALRQGGLGPGQSLLPSALHVHPAHQLIQEYFLCPDRFLFWDFDLPEGFFASGTGSITLALKQKPPAALNESLMIFVSNAVPVVNLFETLSEPVVYDHTRHSFIMRADMADDVHIHSILDIEAILPGESRHEVRRYFPGIQAAESSRGNEPDYFWYSRRKPSADGRNMNTEVFIKTSDGSLPDNELVIVARVLATNGESASTAGRGGFSLNKESESAANGAVLTRSPTPGYDPLRHGDDLWRLVSLFSLQHRTFSDYGMSAVDTLKSILHLYAPPAHVGVFEQTAAILDLTRRNIAYPVRPNRTRPMGGVASGHEYSVTLDRKGFTQTSPYLFAAMLERFFSLQASFGSFTRLKVFSGGQEPLYVWPARNGREAI